MANSERLPAQVLGFLLKILIAFKSFLFTTSPHFEHARVSPVLSTGRKICSQSSEASKLSRAKGSKEASLNFFFPENNLTTNSIKYIYLQNKRLREKFFNGIHFYTVRSICYNI